MKISEILHDIEIGGIALPVFQRGYVWNRNQVKNLMNSLYKNWPTGGILIWHTTREDVQLRPDGTASTASYVSVLLDGQQRVTSLYGVIRGEPPKFFDGDANSFTNLRFNLESQEFEFYKASTMGTHPEWISVTDLFRNGAAATVMPFAATMSDPDSPFQTYMNRAQRLYNIQDIDFPVQLVTGEDKTTEVVVEIFNVVNSGGRKLSRGDLTLSRIGVHWPEARDTMQQSLAKWELSGFSPNLDWLLRCIAARLGSAEVNSLDDKVKQIDHIQRALTEVERAVDVLLKASGTHLAMNGKAHVNKNAFPAMVKYLVDNGGDFPDDSTKAHLFHWYVNASLRGRHSGPVETVVNQDLVALQEENPLEALWETERQRLGGDRPVVAEDFDAVRKNARSALLLNIMPRVLGARDWLARKGHFDVLSDLGSETTLQWHHIFPKAVLDKELNIKGEAANNFGHMALISKEANLALGDQMPEQYLAALGNTAGVLESQWIPADPKLWKLKNYEAFLEARRGLMADAANEFLGSLRAGKLPQPFGGAPEDSSDDEEQAILTEVNSFVTEHGLPAGELDYELVDEAGNVLATLDLAWPNGLQDGLSRPVALLLNEPQRVVNAASSRDFITYTDPDTFQRYVEEVILAEEETETAAAAD